MPSSTPIPRPNTSPETAGNPVADFDIEEWRAGRRTPTRVVPITNDPGAGLRLTELEDQEREARARNTVAAVEGRKTPGRRAGSTSTPELDDIDTQVRAVLADLDGTWTFVHIRRLSPHESNVLADVENRIDRIAKSLASLDKRDNDRPAATISSSPEHPGSPLTEDQWHDMFDVIGNSQTLKLEAALNELTVAVVTPDFSRRVSSLLDGRNSSSS